MAEIMRHPEDGGCGQQSKTIPRSLKLVPQARSTTFSNAIDDLMWQFNVPDLSSGNAGLSWQKALANDVRRVNDLADAFCDDLTALTGVRFRIGPRFDAARVLAKAGDPGEDNPDFLGKLSQSLAAEASRYLCGLPYRVEANFCDSNGTPCYVPVSPLLPAGHDGNKFFRFPSRDGLSVDQVLIVSPKYWPPDRYPGPVSATAFDVSLRVKNDAYFHWPLAIIDGMVDGKLTGTTALVAFCGDDSEMCPLVLDAWNPKAMQKPRLLASFVAWSRRPATRLVLLCLLLIAAMLGMLVSGKSPMAFTACCVVASASLIVAAWSAATRGRSPSPLFPWGLIKASSAEI